MTKSDLVKHLHAKGREQLTQEPPLLGGPHFVLCVSNAPPLPAAPVCRGYVRGRGGLGKITKALICLSRDQGHAKISRCRALHFRWTQWSCTRGRFAAPRHPHVVA